MNRGGEGRKGGGGIAKRLPDLARGALNSCDQGSNEHVLCWDGFQWDRKFGCSRGDAIKISPLEFGNVLVIFPPPPS